MPSTTVEKESMASASTGGVESNVTEVENGPQSVPSESHPVWVGEMESLDPAKVFATSLVREMISRDRVRLFVTLQVEWRDVVLIV